jgi:hypothetical protein
MSGLKNFIEELELKEFLTIYKDAEVERLKKEKEKHGEKLDLNNLNLEDTIKYIKLNANYLETAENYIIANNFEKKKYPIYVYGKSIFDVTLYKYQNNLELHKRNEILDKGYIILENKKGNFYLYKKDKQLIKETFKSKLIRTIFKGINPEFKTITGEGICFFYNSFDDFKKSNENFPFKYFDLYK